MPCPPRPSKPSIPTPPAPPPLPLRPASGAACDRKGSDHAPKHRAQIETCGQPRPPPASSVKIRFLYQVLRANSPHQVFAQTLLAFEVASQGPRVVGLN